VTKKIIYIFLFFSQTSLAQINLVLNPCLENTIKCPDAHGFVDPFVYLWKNPTQGTPDYYNSCAPIGTWCSVPQNSIGDFQYPRTGNGYCGIYAFIETTTNAREYIQGQLRDSLMVGKKYCVNFYVNLANYSCSSISNIGAYFSNTPMSMLPLGVISYNPQIIATNQLADTVNWMLVEGDFVAIGGEKYITIGNFFDDSNTDTVTVAPTPFGFSKVAYYYIDDVSVICCDCQIMIPSTIGANQNFEIAGLPSGSLLYLYNTLGQIVYQNKDYNNDFNSIKVSSGAYFYYVELPGKEIYKGKLFIIR
jgi:hypothetical protein